MTARPRQVELPRLNKPALFEQLDYHPHKGQIAVHRSNAQRRVVASGTRFGKSTLGAAEIVAEMLTPRESSLGWVVAPSLQLTERVFLRVSHMVMTHLSHLVVEYVPRHKIRMLNLSGGVSELRAMSADRPHALLGAALDHVTIDEASHIRDNVWNEFLAPRLIDRNGRALILGTPQQQASWFYREFRRGRPGGDPAYESWTMPTWENPFINKEVIDAERVRLGEELFEQQYAARFGGPPEPCVRCGGPSPDVSGVAVVLEGRPLRKCDLCHEPVDRNGKTKVGLRPDGKPLYSVVRIVRGPTPLTPKEEANLLDLDGESSASAPADAAGGVP
jgi:Terminase large subunit, T4likevirus-type, N-terminal